MTSWQVRHTAGWIIWWMVRRLPVAWSPGDIVLAWASGTTTVS